MATNAPRPANATAVGQNQCRHLSTLEEETRAYELRLECKSYPAIAGIMGLAVSTVYRLVARATGLRLGDVTQKAAAFRQAETERCFQNRLELDVAMQSAQARGDGLAVAKLIEADTRIGQHLAKLHGLNAAEKHEVVAVHVTLEELRARMRPVGDIEE